MDNKEAAWEDSVDYVTLAKAGGRKDLLVHTEYTGVCEEWSPCVGGAGGVDWFAHPTPPPPPPHNHDYQSSLSSSWMTWTLPTIDPPPTHTRDPPPRGPHSRTRSEPIKLPQISEAVDLSRLLSLDYQREWLEEREARQAHEKHTAKLKKAAQKRKLQEHTSKARKIAGVHNTTGGADKARFVMKRFANVPARVKLPPL
ncbi:uncharacterized protein LOC135337383 [Halichondria panicea]|uniref:uncharacterized protein LOC135337383 n=1 Tax=Halichondria panicea TaxID=6063 RepID=UPI00312B8ADB